MMTLAQSMDLMENNLGVKCLHNELKVILYLERFGPSPSLSIKLYLNRSVSAHNTDLKRLKSLGFIDFYVSEEDRRQRLYFLTEQGNNLFTSFVDCIKKEIFKKIDS